MLCENQKIAIKKWRANNREKYNEYLKNWKLAHPEYAEKARQYVIKSRAKKAATLLVLTQQVETVNL